MAQKLILLALADRAGADNTAFPSYDTLHNDTGANRKTIWKTLSDLKEMNLIEDTGERKEPTKGVIVWLLVGVPDRHKDVPEKEQFQNRNSSKSGMDSSTKNGIQNLSVEPTRSCSSYARARGKFLNVSRRDICNSSKRYKS
jgi:pyocin large subunit-like protein